MITKLTDCTYFIALHFGNILVPCSLGTADVLIYISFVSGWLNDGRVCFWRCRLGSNLRIRSYQILLKMVF